MMGAAGMLRDMSKEERELSDCVEPAVVLEGDDDGIGISPEPV